MRDVKQLHPELQEKIKQLQELCVKEGLALGIGECLRTVAEQDELYAQGRTKPGAIITYARGTQYASQHQWGIACDFFKNVAGHAYDDEGFFRKVGALAKTIGLAWGGDWDGFVDMPHLYLPYWGDTPASLKQQYITPQRFIDSWAVKTSKLAVDGWCGPATVRRLQEIFKTTVDGIISDQCDWYREENPGLVAVEWVKYPTEGSLLIARIQEMVGADIDGVIGPDTIRHMQAYFGTYIDGYISGPSSLIIALQEWANKQP